MNATAAAIKRDGASKKSSVRVRRGGMSYSKTRLASSFSLLHLPLRKERETGDCVRGTDLI